MEMSNEELKKDILKKEIKKFNCLDKLIQTLCLYHQMINKKRAQMIMKKIKILFFKGRILIC
jgi:hypothetical protein